MNFEKTQDTFKQIKSLPPNSLVGPSGQQDKGSYYSSLITATSEEPRKLWESLGKVFQCNPENILPANSSDKSLAHKFPLFFCNKISNNRDTSPTSESSNNVHILVPVAFNEFETISEEEVQKVMNDSPT